MSSNHSFTSFSTSSHLPENEIIAAILIRYLYFKEITLDRLQPNKGYQTTKIPFHCIYDNSPVEGSDLRKWET